MSEPQPLELLLLRFHLRSAVLVCCYELPTGGVLDIDSISLLDSLAGRIGGASILLTLSLLSSFSKPGQLIQETLTLLTHLERTAMLNAPLNRTEATVGTLGAAQEACTKGHDLLLYCVWNYVWG